MQSRPQIPEQLTLNDVPGTATDFRIVQGATSAAPASAPTLTTQGAQTFGHRYINISASISGGLGKTATLTCYVLRNPGFWAILKSFGSAGTGQDSISGTVAKYDYTIEARGAKRIYIAAESITIGSTVDVYAEGVTYGG
jgi:hypothetical protein